MSSERHPESRLDAATTKLYVELFLSPTNRIFTDRLREFVSTLPQDVSEPYLSRPQAFSRQDLERWGRQSGYLASSDSEDSSPGVAGVEGPQAGPGGAAVESKGPGPARGSLQGSGQQSSVVGGNISAVTAAVSNPALSSGIEGPRGDLLGSPRGRRASGGYPELGVPRESPGGVFRESYSVSTALRPPFRRLMSSPSTPWTGNWCQAAVLSPCELRASTLGILQRCRGEIGLNCCPLSLAATDFSAILKSSA